MSRSPFYGSWLPTVEALTATLMAMLVASTASLAETPPLQGPLMIDKQGSFFIGGRQVQADTLSTLPAYAPSGTVTVDQVYVRYQVPTNSGQHPNLVLIHGCCLTGKTWETTPDGRMGWDEHFVRKGFPTYVIDQAGRGRSATNIAPINAVKTGKASPDQLPTVFAAGHEPAWAIFRFGPEHPKVFLGMQFPLDAQDEFWKQMVPDWLNALPSPNPTIPALSELAIRLGGAVLISHSQSGVFPFRAAAMNTRDIAGIVSIEPGACPSPTDDLTPYMKMPILVLFGDFVDQSPRWAPRLKACRDFVAAVTKAGGEAELVLLPEIGIKGNSHMLMQDRNSLQVAEWLSGWIDEHVTQKRSAR